MSALRPLHELLGQKLMHEIHLHGPVGGEHFNIRLLDDLPDGPIKIIIDSGGGCSITSFAIYRELIEHPGRITTEVLNGGSAAVLVGLAGQRRTIRADGCIFIHRTWGSVIGTATAMAEAAERMEGWDAAIAAIYQERTGLSLERVYQLLDGETRLSPAEALKLGFVDKIIGHSPYIKHSTTLEKTALACLSCEDATRSAAGTARYEQARPIAAMEPHAGPVLNKPVTVPKLPPGREIETLERFVETERREKRIRQQLALRLRRAINFGGRIDWPVRCTWTCTNCNSENHGPPAQNRLATKCAECGASHEEET